MQRPKKNIRDQLKMLQICSIGILDGEHISFIIPNLRARFPRPNKNLSGFPILFRDFHCHNQMSVITSTNK